MSRVARRGGSASPWFGAPKRAKTDRTSRDLMPMSSWWVDAPDFYEEARRQAPRLIEGGGPLVRHQGVQAIADVPDAVDQSESAA